MQKRHGQEEQSLRREAKSKMLSPLQQGAARQAAVNALKASIEVMHMRHAIRSIEGIATVYKSTSEPGVVEEGVATVHTSTSKPSVVEPVQPPSRGSSR